MLNRILEHNPCEGVKAEKEDGGRTRTVTKDEERRLFRAARPPYDLILALCLYAGLRPGEAQSLDWANVDLDARRITITAKSKTHRTRRVPIPPQLLRRLKKESHRSGPVIRYADGIVMQIGAPFKSSRRAMSGIIRRAGLADFRPYDLRHTFVTRLSDAGVRLEAIQEAAGHASITTTRLYSHTDSKSMETLSMAIAKW